MKKVSNKSGFISALVIYATLLALLSVLTFAIPFPKVDNSVLIVSYSCAMGVIALEGILTLSLLFKEKDGNQRILGLPILYSCFIALIAQLLLTTFFYVCNAFFTLPIWLVFVLEAVLFAYLIVQLSLGFFFKNRNEEYHKNAGDTKFMDAFRVKLKTIVALNDIQNVAKDLENLLDIAKGSDPVTNANCLEAEKELELCIQELDLAVKDGPEEKTRVAIKKTKAKLLERNALCKAGK